MRPSTDRPRGGPLDTPPPQLTGADAAALARKHFGIECHAIPLDSERDQNFRLILQDGRSALLKISNPADDRDAIEMQNAAMLHVANRDPNLPVMLPMRTRDGSLMAAEGGGPGDSYLVRALTFQPGSAYASHQLSGDDLRAFGAIVARMGLALRGFFHRSGGYKILWDLKHSSELRSLLEHLGPDRARRPVEEAVDRFDERVAPFLPGLRAQIIHNDLTLDNVLLDDTHTVSGIVDFGDLTHTALVCDLAIALVSLMWESLDPLGAAQHAIEGYRAVVPLEEQEADVLSDLVCARLVALVLIADWRVRRYPQNRAYITANVGSAWELLERFHALGYEVLRERMSELGWGRRHASVPHVDTEELLERRRKVLGAALEPLSYEHPLHITRARGCFMFAPDGTPYLDAYNNVPVVGHCHPRVVDAIAEQSATLNTNTRYLHHSVVELAERIVATMPEGLDTVMLVNSGSEANDIAWRLASFYTRGRGAIVTERAYHGVTKATAALSPESWMHRPDHVETVPAPDDFRGPFRRATPDWQLRYSAAFDAAIDRLRSREVLPAAAFLDPLFTSDGIFSPPSEYLADVLERLRRRGVLLVADEVQCGFGRSGQHLWSFEASGIVPDFVTLGKPMGNGHPVAAVVTRAEIAERFATRGDLFSTFGGNPVACRAALAVLDTIEREGVRANARDVGSLLQRELTALQGSHPCIGEVRASGLLLGVDLVRDPATRDPAPGLAHAVANGMRERGVLVGTTGRAGNVLKIRPPLVLTTSEAQLIATTLCATLDDVAAAGSGRSSRVASP